MKEKNTIQKNNEQERIIQLQMIEQEATELSQQLELIDNHSSDMQKLLKGLEDLKKTQNKQILANLGKNIYIPAKIESKELLVDVGNKNFVKKNIDETKKIIENQLKKLVTGKQQIIDRIGQLQTEMNQIMKTS